MFMATLGGIGGGAAMLPITLLFFRFSPKASIANTALFEFISTFGRVLYEVISNRGKPGEKKINFHLILIASPLMFFGSFLGVNFNKISPDIIVLIGVTIILTFCVVMSYKKYKSKRKEEKKRERKIEDFESYNSIKEGSSNESQLKSEPKSKKILKKRSPIYKTGRLDSAEHVTRGQSILLHPLLP